MFNQRKVPGRKQRKRERRSKDRRPKSRRCKDDKELDEIAKFIVRNLVSKKNPNINKKFHCLDCNQFYCIGFDGVEVFCRECHFGEMGCLKLSIGKLTCNHCGGSNAKTQSTRTM